MGTEPSALPWGTQWDVVEASGDVNVAAFHVTLGFQDGRAGGRAPVNRYFGMCREEPDGGLALGPLGMTMMAGPLEAMEAEAAYLALLERVRAFRVDGDRLALLDEAGAPLLLLRPSADPE
jgi:heat shock protein HslJ